LTGGSGAGVGKFRLHGRMAVINLGRCQVGAAMLENITYSKGNPKRESSGTRRLGRIWTKQGEIAEGKV